MLAIESLSADYGAARALFDVSLKVAAGETVALVGANGAGKTTLLKSVMGLVKPSGGRILLGNRTTTGHSPARMVRQGLALSPEGREVFSHLSVAENLILGSIPLRLSRRDQGERMAA